MDKDLDGIDRAILRLIADDSTLSLGDIAEQDGIIRKRVAVLDPDKIGLPVSVFVAVETADHSSEWLARFAAVVQSTPEVVDAWRMSGDVDYLLHVVVPDIAAYDTFYRKLIAAVPLRNVTSRFAMERMKNGPLPIP
jgi:Lrp/AsnC family transcriptional regulator